MKIIKKVFLSLIVFNIFLTINAQANSCDCESTGRSYLAVRQHFLSASPERVAAFRNERVRARKDGRNGVVSCIVYGSRSTDEDARKRYFTPFCKTSLIVDERAEENVISDLRSTHFNIFTKNQNFRSKITFKPRQTVIGVGLHYRQGFWKNEETNRGLFFSIAAPISRVKNNMGLCEFIINDGGGADIDADENVVANMKEALVQSEWCFGKIDCKSHTKTRLAFIELKIGYEWLQHDPYHLESYFGVIAPTGNDSKGEFLFEPISGNGQHFGVTFGSAIGFQIWDNDEKDRHLRVEYANSTQYLFRDTQKRSFDLKNKPWSRYMEVYESKAQAQKAAALVGVKGITLATPGINVFTKDVKVTPGVAHTLNTAFVFTSGGFQGEAGYNFYVQSSECIKLACPWQEGPAIKHVEGKGQTNPVRDITGNLLLEGAEKLPLEDFGRAIITAKDLDLVSASTPCLISHTIFIDLGYRWDNREYPIFINGGGSYEFSSSSNAEMQRWTIWAKGGFSF